MIVLNTAPLNCLTSALVKPPFQLEMTRSGEVFIERSRGYRFWVIVVLE